MSHDIRTPMNAVLGFTALLAKDAENPDKVKTIIFHLNQNMFILSRSLWKPNDTKPDISPFRCIFYRIRKKIDQYVLCCILYYFSNRQQEKLRREREEEREVYSRQLAEALQAAQIASSSKTTFLSNMSHDIRTPMNAVDISI